MLSYSSSSRALFTILKAQSNPKVFFFVFFLFELYFILDHFKKKSPAEKDVAYGIKTIKNMFSFTTNGY